MKKLMLLLVLLSLPIAYASLQGSVRNDQKVALVGATVEVIGSNGTVGTAKVISGGSYSIDVPDGIYFLNISDSSYPSVIMLVGVTGQTNVDVIMTKTPPSCIYGIASSNEPTSWKNIYALKKNRMYSYAQIQQNGMYLLSGLDAGDYNVTVSPGDYENVTKEISLQASSCARLDIELKKKQEANGNITAFELIAPNNVTVEEKIIISLTENGAPAKNTVISVTTPKGELTLTTDETGSASIYAADEGSYSFSFQNITKTTKAIPKGATGGNATNKTDETRQKLESKQISTINFYLLAVLIGVLIFLLLLPLVKQHNAGKQASVKETGKPEEKPAARVEEKKVQAQKEEKPGASAKREKKKGSKK